MTPVSNTVALPGFWTRIVRGISSMLGVLLFPLGRWGRIGGEPASTAQRRAAGLVIVLPGIECRSFLNRSIVRGLIDGHVKSAVEIWDWTTGFLLLFAFHLRGRRNHRSVAKKFANRIVEYRSQHPGQPVQLIGHSGGGGIALFILESLPEDCDVTSAILLGPAVSPRYDVRPAARRCQRGIVHFFSPLDAFFLGISTLVLGTMDGRHSFAAGALGFRDPMNEENPPPLQQRRYRPAMLSQYNLGGHFGWTNRVFVAESLAPLISEHESSDCGQRPD